MRGAKCWTAHRLIRAVVKDTPDANIQNTTLAEDCTEKWDQFKNVVIGTAKSVLGHKQQIHQDWLDDNHEQLTQLLQE